jgi:hypothetical protein
MTLRHGVIGGATLVFIGASWLWAKNGAAILLNLSWTGCF